jgi:hypothetical protein
LRNENGVSERRACQAMQMNRSSYATHDSRIDRVLADVFPAVVCR